MGDIVLQAAQEAGYSDFQLDLIRNTAAKGCSDTEIAQLLYIALKTGLDPIMRQVYMIKRKQKNDQNQWVEVAAPQTGIDGYRLLADRTKRYAPGKAPTFDYREDGTLYSATAYVKKLAGDVWHEVAATAIYDEYAQGQWNNERTDFKPNRMWQQMPHSQLAKCAEALALRRAFPAELSGLYTNEEMGQADNPAPVVEVLPRQEREPSLLEMLYLYGEELGLAEVDTKRILRQGGYSSNDLPQKFEEMKQVLFEAIESELTLDNQVVPPA